MDSPQQCVPTHCFLRLEPSIVQATSFHQQLPLWMCLPLTHPSSLFSLGRDFSPPPDFRTVRNCPEPLSMRRRTAFLRQGCRILYIVGVCVNRIGTPYSMKNNSPKLREAGFFAIDTWPVTPGREALKLSQFRVQPNSVSLMLPLNASRSPVLSSMTPVFS